MKRIAAILLILIAIGGPAWSQTALPGPASPSQARIYFYRLVETSEVTRWTPVFLDDAKVGDLGERSYFFRDVPPGPYTVGVSSDVPYQDQYRRILVAPGSTTFVRVFIVPGYGIQFRGGGLNSPPSIYRPSVFGSRLEDASVARQDMAGLSPAQ